MVGRDRLLLAVHTIEDSRLAICLPFTTVVLIPRLLSPFFLESSLDSKEVDLDGIDLILLLLALLLDSGRQQEDILGRSFVIEVDFGFILQLEEPNRLPKFSVIIPGLLAAQPLLIVGLSEICKAFFGKVEPGGLVCREDQSLVNCVDALETFGGRDYDHTLCEHSARGVMTEGEVCLRVVGYVEIG